MYMYLSFKLSTKIRFVNFHKTLSFITMPRPYQYRLVSHLSFQKIFLFQCGSGFFLFLSNNKIKKALQGIDNTNAKHINRYFITAFV